MNAETTTQVSVSGATEAKPTPTGTPNSKGLHTQGSVGVGRSSPKAPPAQARSASGHAAAGAHSATSVKAGVMAGKTGILVKGVAVAGLGDAGVAAAAHTGAVMGLSVALANVPVWPHARAVLSALSQRLHVMGKGAVSLGF